MSARDKAGEVLAAHRIEGVGPGGECWCACGMGDEGHGTLWNAEGHRAHVVDALAEAGLLLDKGVLLDVLSKSKARAEKAERERDEAREALARVEALLDEATGYSVPYRRSRFFPIDSSFTKALRAALRGDDA